MRVVPESAFYAKELFLRTRRRNTYGNSRKIKFDLTVVQTADRRASMTSTKSTRRLIAAMLVTVAVIGLSTVATHTPGQNQTWLTLKDIRTDSATTLYVDNRDRGSWFCEMVLPTGAYADAHQDRGSWFCEMALPTGDNAATENLKSVAATL